MEQRSIRRELEANLAQISRIDNFIANKLKEAFRNMALERDGLLERVLSLQIENGRLNIIFH